MSLHWYALNNPVEPHWISQSAYSLRAISLSSTITRYSWNVVLDWMGDRYKNWYIWLGYQQKILAWNPAIQWLGQNSIGRRVVCMCYVLLKQTEAFGETLALRHKKVMTLRCQTIHHFLTKWNQLRRLYPMILLCVLSDSIID